MLALNVNQETWYALYYFKFVALKGKVATDLQSLSEIKCEHSHRAVFMVMMSCLHKSNRSDGELCCFGMYE